MGAWIDGAMPQRAETVRGYVQGMHQAWLRGRPPKFTAARPRKAASASKRVIVYNPDVKSLVAMVPCVIPQLLMLIPAMLAALSVVREKEARVHRQSIRDSDHAAEFLIGKQLPYVALGMLNSCF